MKISYNWLCDYIKCDLSAAQMAEVLTAIGLEVESVEKFETIRGGLKGVVVGEVIECAQHPDADRLKLTKVNLGSSEPFQIVCGAPNVAVGQKVLVATIGTTLYPVSGEPLQIKKGKIRGQESHGMICAEDELGIGESHAGILVLDASAKIGTPASEFLNIKEDYLLEIGLTPNRTDAMSHYGVARDLAAALKNMEGRAAIQCALVKPSVDSFSVENSSLEIPVEVKNSEACPRYAGLTISNLKIAPSPDWLQQRLKCIGLRPINNVVDITNYVQHETGQPLHAFDAEKIGGKKIIVRLASEGEEFKSLDGMDRKLSSQDLMICDASKPMCIAGVFGGIESGVTETTTSIFLESAYFNPVYIRKTAKRHGLNTDASFRFERGVDPNGIAYALKRAAILLSEIAGRKVTSGVTDIYPNPIADFPVVYNWQRTESLIGKNIPHEKVKHILSDLEIKVESENENELSLLVPPYRNDVNREADVAEEVLRIYGYDNIEFPQQLRTSLAHAPRPDHEKIKNQIADMLVANGFSEIMAMSLTPTRYAENFVSGNVSAERSVQILNPLSSDLGAMRQSLLFGGLESIALNSNFKNPNLRLFEFGKTYHVINGKNVEQMQLAFLITGKKNPESWNNTNDDVSFTDLRAAFENVIAALGVETSFGPSTHAHFSEALEFSSKKKTIATLGNVSTKSLNKFDIKQNVWYAEILWEELMNVMPQQRTQYKALEKFPAVRRDLSLLVGKAVKYAELERLAFDSEKKLLREVGLFDVYEGKNLEADKKSYALRFILQDSSKTLTDEQVDAAMGRIRKAFEEKVGAVLR